ncbi:MAG: chemotaxis protein CheR [Desulfobacterales bacterium]|nr:chemotaxis protein CheR [Desulfobacterales bacterium]
MDYNLNSIEEYEYNSLKEIVDTNFGINLNREKKSLIVSRLKEYLKNREFNNFKDYVKVLRDDKTGIEISELINRITTNHTFFFREKEHYNFFKDVVIANFEEKLTDEKDFRMWCAGCSYGDEPYSFQILLFEHFKNRYKKWKAGLLATDISEKALNYAKKGSFSEQRLRNIPNDLKLKYFIKKEDYWEIIDKVKKEVVFRRFNLMNENFPYKKKFHVISCRNVMIYFNEDKRTKLLYKLYDFIEDGGLLFIGHSEYINRQISKFKYIMPGIYQKGI